MSPSQQDRVLEQDPQSSLQQSRQPLRSQEAMTQSSGAPLQLQRLRNNDESWVEISSQPSSSSLSSIGDEIVTTGLRVQHDSNAHRRRRLQQTPSRINLPYRQTSTSSQEEYEESESDDDQVMTSSNEHITPATRLFNMPQHTESSDEDDDDENATALGRRTTEPFTPQPNAFSHPPPHQHRRSEPGSYFPATRRQSSEAIPYSSRRAASYQADHDAALRASLTTLLSIGAAAARGKRNQQHANTSLEPVGLRLVPESELLAGPPPVPANTSRPLSPSTRAKSSPSVTSAEAIEKGKRKAASATAMKSSEKKKRRKGVQGVVGEEAVTVINPTLLTWVMSAGVLVLVSVVGFGAGYVIGREVGRQEVLSGFQGGGLTDSGSCGREMVRGTGGGSLRRFKWGIGGGRISVVA